MRSMAWGLIAIVACRTPPPVPVRAQPERHAATGSPSDSVLAAGAYDGYTFTRTCEMQNCVGLQGTGSGWWPGLERGHMDAEGSRAAFEQLRTSASRVLSEAGVRSVAGSGFDGVGCPAGGLSLHLTDWRELDIAVRALGGFLKSRGLREPIAVCVHDNDIPPGESL